MRALLTVVSLMIASSAFAFDQIPANYDILTDPAGPAVAAHLGEIHPDQTNLKDCQSFAVYTGDTTLQLGDQTYKLTHIASTAESLCPGDKDFKKFSQLMFVFQNTVYQNQIRFILDQTTMPLIDVVLDQGHVVPGRAR